MEFRRAEDDEGRYGWIEQVLRRFEYRRLGRADKGAVLAYLQHLSGYSRAQATRLVARWVNGKPLVKNYGIVSKLLLQVVPDPLALRDG